jgi:hypothetical protein
MCNLKQLSIIVTLNNICGYDQKLIKEKNLKNQASYGGTISLVG